MTQEPVNCTPSELSTFLQGLAAGYWVTPSWAMSLSAPSNSIPIASKSWRSDKQTVCCRGFPSLQMSAPLMDARGADWWTASVLAFRVPPSPVRVSGGRMPTSGTAGRGRPESLARFDPATRSWRTSVLSLLTTTSEPYSGSWPRSGTMSGGIVYPRRPSAPLTAGTGSGSGASRPTPTVTDSTREDARNGVPQHVLESPTPVAGHNLGLTHAVKLWPTPNTQDAKGAGSMASRIDGRQMQLHSAVKLWPTPRTRGLLGGSASREMVRDLVDDGVVDAETASAMLGVKLWPTPRSTDGEHGGCVTPRKTREGGNLIEAVSARTFPTPAARDWKDAGTSPAELARHTPHLAASVGGQLNPDWVELLMGWPLGWTRLDPLDPAAFETWLAAFRSGKGASAWRDGTWEDGVPRVAVKTPHRVPRLTALGNGQVPLVVAVAWGTLVQVDDLTAREA